MPALLLADCVQVQPGSQPRPQDRDQPLPPGRLDVPPCRVQLQQWCSDPAGDGAGTYVVLDFLPIGITYRVHSSSSAWGRDPAGNGAGTVMYYLCNVPVPVLAMCVCGGVRDQHAGTPVY